MIQKFFRRLAKRSSKWSRNFFLPILDINHLWTPVLTRSEGGTPLFGTFFQTLQMLQNKINEHIRKLTHTFELEKPKTDTFLTSHTTHQLFVNKKKNPNYCRIKSNKK